MPFRYRKRGGLLPRLFTLTKRFPKEPPGSLFSVALSVSTAFRRYPPAINRHHFRRSPDFPLSSSVRNYQAISQLPSALFFVIHLVRPGIVPIIFIFILFGEIVKVRETSGVVIVKEIAFFLVAFLVKEDAAAIGTIHDFISDPHFVRELGGKDHVTTITDISMNGNNTDTLLALDDAFKLETGLGMNTGDYFSSSSRSFLSFFSSSLISLLIFSLRSFSSSSCCLIRDSSLFSCSSSSAYRRSSF